MCARRKKETRGESHNHAPQYGINTLSGKATMMNKERQPYEYAWYYTRYKGLYDRILTVLKAWDIWHIKAFDGVMSLYEGEVVQLLKHLPSTHNADEVYHLLIDIFAETDPFFDYAHKTEALYRMAQEIGFLWSQYLKIQDAQPSARARALLLHYEPPMTAHY